MAKDPGFTLTAAVALSLGIGANATVFAITRCPLLECAPRRRLLMVPRRRPAAVAISTAVSKHNATVRFFRTSMPKSNPNLQIPSLWAGRAMRLL